MITRWFTSSLVLACALYASEGESICLRLPELMAAARIHQPGCPESLRIEYIPLPVAARGEVVVRVWHAAVNPVDWKLQIGGGLPYPATPGGDFSGQIAALGADVQGWRCGDRVAGIVDQRTRGGSYAEYLSVPVSDIVRVPDSVSMDAAAAFPTVAVAAWRYLVQGARIQAGERVLVHGGAGGVGSMLVQLAHRHGAEVIATASTSNHAYLSALGADQLIDYRTTRFEDVLSDLDVVIDTVGGDTLARSPAVLRDGGRLLTLVGQVPSALCGRIVCPPSPPWNVAEGLAGTLPLLASGQLKVHIDRRYPLRDVAAAQAYNQAGHTRGKVVIDLLPEPAP